MKKLALVLGDGTLTGAPMHTLQLAKSFKKDFEILVICPHGSITKKFAEEKIPVKEIAMRGPLDRDSISKIAKALEEFDADIAHFHGTRGGWLGLLATRNNKKIKKVYTEHLWTNDYHLSNPAYEQFQKRGLKFLSRYADKIIAVSVAVKDFLIKNGYEKEKIVLINNGVDDRFLKINRIKKPAEAPIILGSIGSLNDLKNYRIILKAFYLAKKEKPNLNIHYQIVGEGPLRKNLENMATQLKISEFVHFAGRVSDVAERLEHFSIFINCSKSESFGLSLGEAMAVGLPVIGSNIPALKDLIADCGVLVNQHYADDVKDAILELAEDLPLREKLSSKAKDRIANHFSEKAMISKTRTLYDNLLK